MKLLANENFPLDSVYLLKKRGYDVFSVSLESPSIDDEAVMRIAIDQNRTILTFDRDYGELVFKKGYRPSEGVIYLRVEPIYPEYPAELVRHLLETAGLHFENTLTVVDENRIRQRPF
ncbi:MAG: DUF5615 family PIN-like protein [Saprospiraceae bacterium]